MLPPPLQARFILTRLNDVDRHEVMRCKSGLLKLPKVITVTYGNYLVLYQSILSWNELQKFLSLDDMSTLGLYRLKDWIRLYYLSEYF